VFNNIPYIRLPCTKELLDLVPGHQALLCTSDDKVDKELLDRAGEQLKLVCTMSAGFNHIDIAEARSRNITLGHTPGVLTDSVAEVNVSLVLSCLRNIVTAANSVTTGDWEREAAVGKSLFTGLGDSLVGKTVGILGLGRIGLATVQRLLPFKISTVYYSNRGNSSLAEEIGAVRVDLPSLASLSDIVIVCASLNDSSEHIVDKQFLDNMKESSYLINTARGGLVDQEALVEALRTGRIRGAGLDVMTPEPLPLSNPLATCPNLVLLPHIGSATIRTREDMAKLTVENVIAGLKGEPLPAPIS